jgi:hypothetical protein
MKEVTIRANGKAHPAIELSPGQYLLCCKCPGSRNGQLARQATKVAEGHEAANCNKN